MSAFNVQRDDFNGEEHRIFGVTLHRVIPACSVAFKLFRRLSRGPHAMRHNRQVQNPMRTTPLAPMVVPLYNEASVDPPVKAVRAAMADVPEWELILIDDGSQDRTPEMAEKVAESDPRIRVGHLARTTGNPGHAGRLDLAAGDVIVSMDGDLQNDLADIPQLIAKLEEGTTWWRDIASAARTTCSSEKFPAGSPIRSFG